MNIECGWCRDGEQLIEGCIEGDGYYAGCPEWYHKKGENKQCASESDAKELKSVNDANKFDNYIDSKLEKDSKLESGTLIDTTLYKE